MFVSHLGSMFLSHFQRATRWLCLLALPFGVVPEALGAPCTPASADCSSIAWGATYTGDSWYLAKGGLPGTTTREAYLDNLEVVADVDGERLFGVAGLQFHAAGLYNNGRGFSSTAVGDVQGISNIEAVPAARLYELWADWQVGEGTSWRAGLYDLNSEFDAIETAGLFLNPSHGIAADFAQSGMNGPSIFPVAALALRWRRQWGAWQWQVAALEGIPGNPEDPRRSSVRFTPGEGLLLVAEAGHEFAEGARLAVGSWRYTASFDHLEQPAPQDAARRVAGGQGAYLLLEGGLPVPALARAGWRGFLRLGAADPRVHATGSYLGAGVVREGGMLGRSGESMGLAVACAQSGSAWRRTLAAQGTRPAARECNLELTWRLPVTRWLTLQPDLQWLSGVGYDRGAPKALAAGLRFEFAWPPAAE